MNERGVWALVVVAGCIAAVQACGSDSESDGAASGSGGSTSVASSSSHASVSSSSKAVSSSSGPPPDCGNFAWNDAPCNDCSLQSCCAQMQACDVGSDCDTYFQCIAGCADADCWATCGTDNSAGLDGYSAVFTCLEKSCPDDCMMVHPGICVSTLTFQNTACDLCLSENCCAQFTNCADPDQQACIDCLNSMGKGPCDAEGNAAINCFNTKCGSDCGFMIMAGVGGGGGMGGMGGFAGAGGKGGAGGTGGVGGAPGGAGGIGGN